MDLFSIIQEGFGTFRGMARLHSFGWTLFSTISGLIGAWLSLTSFAHFSLSRERGLEVIPRVFISWDMGQFSTLCVVFPSGSIG